MNHKNFLFDDYAFDIERPNGKRVEPEIDEILKAVGINRVRILIGGQREGFIADNQRFLKLGKHRDTTERRSRRGSQKRVIPARVRARNGLLRKTYDAVRLQPFSRRSVFKIRTNIFIETYHYYFCG